MAYATVATPKQPVERYMFFDFFWLDTGAGLKSVTE